MILQGAWKLKYKTLPPTQYGTKRLPLLCERLWLPSSPYYSSNLLYSENIFYRDVTIDVFDWDEARKGEQTSTHDFIVCFYLFPF